MREGAQWSLVGSRMFVALRLEPQIVAQLSSLVDPRRDVDPDVRWASEASWHVTCAFAADVPAALVDPFAEALQAVGERTSGLGLRLGGAGCFPHPDAAKALWLAVRSVPDEEDLPRLARRVRTSAQRLGIEVAGGRFVGHLTLARTRRRLAVARWLRVLDAFGSWDFRVEAMELVESHLGRGPARHHVVSTVPLQHLQPRP